MADAQGAPAAAATVGRYRVSRWLWNRFTALAWVTTTPFGTPVDPDV
ncbi:hypothetical protein ACFQV2_18490 [Actinokineospora soli]|uniref:Uncharacterized protein n=1 Tax=Actinokineospora soli TaxID=1048753 RepID=A0ABW2TN48_9PSEU